MGLPEAKAAAQTLVGELNSLPASYDKLNLILKLLEVAEVKRKETKQALKASPATNISELPKFSVVDEAGNVYDADPSTGELTPR